MHEFITIEITKTCTIPYKPGEIPVYSTYTKGESWAGYGSQKSAQESLDEIIGAGGAGIIKIKLIDEEILKRKIAKILNR